MLYEEIVARKLALLDIFAKALEDASQDLADQLEAILPALWVILRPDLASLLMIGYGSRLFGSRRQLLLELFLDHLGLDFSL